MQLAVMSSAEYYKKVILMASFREGLFISFNPADLNRHCMVNNPASFWLILIRLVSCINVPNYVDQYFG